MNRRQFAVALPIAFVITGCDNDQKPAATPTLLNNGGVQDALKALADAVDTMESDVGDFESESWRDVVPKVTESAADVSSAFQALRRALSVPNAQ